MLQKETMIIPKCFKSSRVTLQKSICYFDNCICHQSCNCWPE